MTDPLFLLTAALLTLVAIVGWRVLGQPGKPDESVRVDFDHYKSLETSARLLNKAL